MLSVSKTSSGLFVAFIVTLLISSALLSLLFYAPSINLSSLWQDSYLHHVTLFSIKQALLSTLLSVGFAVPIAHAIARRQFKGRTLLLKLFSMTLVLPTLVGVFGLLAIYGKNGLIAQALSYFGSEWNVNIYGLKGILLAHVFFNLPFSIQLLVQALEQIPSSQKRLAYQLGIKGWSKFKYLEWPFLCQQLPHTIGLVFMLCFTSFAVIMALGGGPKATTIELAIYQAIRFDFDLQTGAILALWQLFLCSAFHLIINKMGKALPIKEKTEHYFFIYTKQTWLQKAWDLFWIALVILLVIPPIMMVIFQGINSSSITVLTQSSLWQATANSLIIASVSAFSACLLGFALVNTSRFYRMQRRVQSARWVEMSASLILVVPSIVLATGLFLMLRNYIDLFGSPYSLVIIVNTLMALPYVVNILNQPAYQLLQQYQHLCDSLGIKGFNRLKLVEWRALKAPIAKALGISFVLSTGDLGAIALVGSQDFQTLPLHLFHLMGSYQMQGAACTALVLFSLSLASYSLIEKIITGKSNAKS